MSHVYGDPEPAQDVLRTSHFLSGGVLLGVPGNVVVGHGASGRDEFVACINRAVQLLDAAVIDRLRGSLRDFSSLDARGELESE